MKILTFGLALLLLTGCATPGGSSAGSRPSAPGTSAGQGQAAAQGPSAHEDGSSTSGKSASGSSADGSAGTRRFPRQASAANVAEAALPQVEFTPDSLHFDLPAALTSRFQPTAMLSPDGGWLSFTYEIPGGPSGQPMVALAAMPLPPSAPEPRVLTWVSLPQDTARNNPGLRLVGWPDNRRIAVVVADPNGLAADRVELLDVADGSVSAGAWFTFPDSTRYSLARMQAWLTGDGTALMLNTGDLWRIPLPGGSPTLVKANLPAPQHGGPGATIGGDGWSVLCGGGETAAPYTVVDLHSGRETELPWAWTRLATGPGGNFATLERSAEAPGASVPDNSGAIQLYSTVTLADPAGAVFRRIPAPKGWLLRDLRWAAPDLLVLEAAQVGPDPQNPALPPRIAETALLAQPVDGGAARMLWQAPEPLTGGVPFWLAGRWLIAGGRQIPLEGGSDQPMPTKVTGILLSSGPDGLIARGEDGTLYRFAAGSKEATAIGRPAGIDSLGGTATVQNQLGGPWLLQTAQGPLGKSAFALFRIR